ncbi:MAG: lysoplasmalogenase [Candidatus Aminicenantales bacterium]
MDREFLLIAAVAISAILTIIGRYSRRRQILYVFKPLTMGMIIFKAATSPPGYGIIYQALILLGLIISLVGDIFLMLPRDKFTQGSISFFAAHVFYALAFAQNVHSFFWIGLAPFFIFAAVLFILLQRHLGRFRIPILLYMIVISLMAWLAANRYFNFRDSETLFALIGGFLFLISDSILALNKFKKPFKPAQAFILSTYFIAQLLIASSF